MICMALAIYSCYLHHEMTNLLLKSLSSGLIRKKNLPLRSFSRTNSKKNNASKTRTTFISSSRRKKAEVQESYSSDDDDDQTMSSVEYPGASASVETDDTSHA